MLRPSRFLRIVLTLCCLGLIGCGDDAPAAVCTPGMTQLCVGPGGCTGGQSCLSDGSGWDTCLCDQPPPIDAGSDGGVQTDAGMDAGADAGPEDAGPTDAGVDAGPPPVDQCLSAPDLSILTTPQPQGDAGFISGVEYAQDTAEDCTRTDCLSELFGSGDYETCMVNCKNGTDISALSLGCWLCFAGEMQCATTHCAVSCLGTDADLCAMCIAENCRPARAACIGF